MITLENVNKYFNKGKKNQIHVIDNTSIEIEDKGLVALLGNSGSGKTTLLNAIGGLDKINSGKIYVNGEKITRHSKNKIDDIRNLNIGYIFQNYLLIDDLTVYENVALPLKMIGIKDKKEIKKRVDYILEVVGIYKYRNRLASMLSGGERQRVGIARAIVKNPRIIIADEPTGNLDSKNSLEVMNIIKSISNDKLVILVTHERELANFYASRILDIVDGKIITDKKNEHSDDLDYRIDNKIYLKDMENHSLIKSNNVNIDYYSDSNSQLNVKIVLKNNNIYLECDNKYNIIDNDSNIELVDDHYKKITQDTYLKYKFDFDKLINDNYKLKYTSIYNSFNLLINGFKKVFNYPILKKILLLGFLISSLFITYSVCNITGLINITDDKFVKTNTNYLSIITNKIDQNKFSEIENNAGINYILPGNSTVYFNIKFDDYLQTKDLNAQISGSLGSLNMINIDDIKEGRMPENDYEIVIDKRCLNSLFNDKIPNQIGITDASGFIGRTVTIKYMPNFKIVGITDLNSPSIYISENIFTNLLSNTSKDYYGETSYVDSDTKDIVDYNLIMDKIELKKGRLPENDYEVIVNLSNEEDMKLNKPINTKINGTNLTVVGYYSSKYNLNDYYVNLNTVKYNLIEQSKNITIYAKDKETTLSELKENKLNIVDSYTKDKNEYIKSIKENIVSNILIALIILVISLIEIFLMMRSSFLSRIKEVGILRAIGLKKKDIYKMFLGEILSISIITGVTGVIIMSSIINGLTEFSYFKDQFLVNPLTIVISLIIIFVFNIVIGLLPVFNTLRKTPAGILSRNDID